MKSLDAENLLKISNKILLNYIENNIINLIQLVKDERKYSLQRKFILLLITFLLEDTNLLDILVNSFSKEYEREFNCNKKSVYGLFYSKNNYKIIEAAFVECIQNNEMEIIKYIFNSNNNVFLLREEFLVSFLKNTNITILNEIAKMNLKYLHKISVSFKNRAAPVELNNKELLKLICKEKFPNILIYTFILKSFSNINEAIIILIKAKSNNICQLLLNSSKSEKLKI